MAVCEREQLFSITIYPQLLISCNFPPAGLPGVPYGPGGSGHLFPVVGGAPAYTWAIIDGALPDGLTLDGATGIVSGTPTTSGTFTFTIQVTDSNGAISAVVCSISTCPRNAQGVI